MHKFTKNAFLVIAGVVFAGTMLASCNKKDEALITDFNAKKASADKLVADANSSSATMKADHQAWLAKLDVAAKAPKADTAKINGFRQDIRKHEEDMSKDMALVDSVKFYENAPAETNEQMKAANENLGKQFDDLSAKWKTLSDAHAKLGADITAFLGGSAAQKADSTLIAKEVKKETAPATKEAPKKVTPPTPPANVHETPVHTPGVPKHSAPPVK